MEKLDEVVISAEREKLKTQVYTSVQKITPKQMAKIPTVGSEPDLAQYLQVLPGVIFTGDQGGQLYIRGGAPIQNKVLKKEVKQGHDVKVVCSNDLWWIS